MYRVYAPSFATEDFFLRIHLQVIAPIMGWYRIGGSQLGSVTDKV